jgi:hypothetical protein
MRLRYGNKILKIYKGRKRVMKYHKNKLIQAMEKSENILTLLVVVIIPVFILLSGTTWAATYTAASCSMSDVQAIIDDSGTVSGDLVQIPAGGCTWGASGTYLSVNKAITLMGAGQGQTIITLSDSGGKYTNGTIRIYAAATVRSMTINGSNANPVCAFSTSTKNGWRITDIDYNGGTSGAYFAYIGGVYGLIDNNDITGGAGTAELIFARGPTDSWQTPHSIGGVDNLFIVDNTFNGSGYVCDINANGRAVLRYNTITGNMKIDGHGVASNSPARGVRHMEIYNNHWTAESGFWLAMEIRGGGGRIFNNVIDNGINFNYNGVVLTDYCYTSNIYGNCNGNVEPDHCACPTATGDQPGYPITDQIGVGIDPKSAGSEPLYLWNNIKNGDPLTLLWRPTTSCTTPCGGAFDLVDVIQEGIDYFQSETKPAAMADYTPYGIYLNGRYYHPLQKPSPPKNLRINN